MTDLVEKLREALRKNFLCLHELVAVVRGECPSLLDEDSGGDAKLDLEIDEALIEARAAIAALTASSQPPSNEDRLREADDDYDRYIAGLTDASDG